MDKENISGLFTDCEYNNQTVLVSLNDKIRLTDFAHSSAVNTYERALKSLWLYIGILYNISIKQTQSVQE